MAKHSSRSGWGSTRVCDIWARPRQRQSSLPEARRTAWYGALAMSHSYSEDQLVEQPAIQLFADMGWQTASATEEVFGVGGTLGRETKGEAVLVPRLRAALQHLNPSLRPEALSGAIDQLARAP